MLSKKWIWIAVMIAVAALYVTLKRITHDTGRRPRSSSPVPVETAPVTRGTMILRRTFSGTIESRARFTVAPKVSGRIKKLLVDISDTVRRGGLIAELEDAEFQQAVAEARARLAVAEANLVEARSLRGTALRALERSRTLNARGIASESELDAAQAEFNAGEAAVEVAEATLLREKAALAAAEIRLDYTRIKAEWEQGDDERTVAERFAEEGNTVAANTPLFSIVELDPVVVVIQVTEKDYPYIQPGRSVSILSDAFPDRQFTGTVIRIAPVFQVSSRQARVEVEAANPGHLLKPGMFARSVIELKTVEDAVSVPEIAVTRRREQTGVFLVDPSGETVSWVPVSTGIREGDRVQVTGAEISGRVVTLGQQFIEDGSRITIPEETETPRERTGTQ